MTIIAARERILAVRWPMNQRINKMRFKPPIESMNVILQKQHNLIVIVII